MSNRIGARAPSATPIERIFEKVMLRKMNEEERVLFHLKSVRKQGIGNPGYGMGLQGKAILKLAV